jgi:3',5'-cyclic AMP phosphodiesterase CpdA
MSDPIRRLAHLSDLHLGIGPDVEAELVRISAALEHSGVDHLIVTGDVTDRGRVAELDAFERCLGHWRDAGALSVVPGNHDRLGDDVADAFIPGTRVHASVIGGTYVVRVDSTGPHNRNLLAGHGLLTDDDLAEIDWTLRAAPPGLLRVLAMHHHPLPLPEETLPERVSTWLGWPYAAELAHGPHLLARIAGRCDLLLHGHRHVPSATRIASPGTRPLWICNAGQSTRLGRVRVFDHCRGELVASPLWLDCVPRPPVTAPSRRTASMTSSEPGRRAVQPSATYPTAGHTKTS